MDLSDTPIAALPPTPAGNAVGQLYPLLDVGGPTVRPIVLGDLSILLGTIPAGRFVPLHAHLSHTETFVVQSGVMEGLLVEESGAAEWASYGPGDNIHVPAGVKHAWRNVGTQPTTSLIVTAAPLANFFLDIGRPIDSIEAAQWPPDPQLGAKAAAVAESWGMWNGSPEENAAVGLPVG